MRKITGLILAVFCLFMAVSCNNGTTEVAPDSPTNIVITVNADPVLKFGAYILDWDLVIGAVGYKFYLKSNEFPEQKIEILSYISDEIFKFGILWSDFKLLSLYGTGPYQFGISAVGASGLESEIAWSSSTNNIF